MKTKLAKVSVLLVTLVTVGCSSTPAPAPSVHCASLPQRPQLPKIDAGQLWDKVGEAQYSELVNREKKIVDWAIELETVLKGVCNNG